MDWLSRNMAASLGLGEDASDTRDSLHTHPLFAIHRPGNLPQLDRHGKRLQLRKRTSDNEW